ncbi:hypothetical protein AtNW77_Chr2g0262631 [Arabidopsis thaliana]|uniref:Uncharacterized protein n=2 Tax=Arabidopsis thaliana TaxID=3702 RepID=A0A654F0N6_ARATH|nr:uncharacterized protein AT2G40715 [Arabidopsis thaliana]ANM63293.1 hypothetical protein AT2G40715 [Arabidopsis thaliana]CAA0375983.1 unnamed protein product [Arabidopsis thaliana]VYS55097.1 unnamed protein product [Arabidopsis thaliana]|eukprot:NP_001325388.1 hypothetical protein AT2G40715 [Arabidopsis thaliana]
MGVARFELMRDALLGHHEKINILLESSSVCNKSYRSSCWDDNMIQHSTMSRFLNFKFLLVDGTIKWCPKIEKFKFLLKRQLRWDDSIQSSAFILLRLDEESTQSSASLPSLQGANGRAPLHTPLLPIV